MGKQGKGVEVYHRLFHREKGLQTRSSGCECDIRGEDVGSDNHL